MNVDEREQPNCTIQPLVSMHREHYSLVPLLRVMVFWLHDMPAQLQERHVF